MKPGVRTRFLEFGRNRPLQFLTIAALVAATAAAAAPLSQPQSRAGLVTAVEQAVGSVRPEAPAPLRLVWDGADVDGDGRADFANPTGQAPRGRDAYGEGEFGASRDGGSRKHEGVDFVAEAGQAVAAPISGYVTKIGYAYDGDPNLKFVEITNPALRFTARVFYINPRVDVGDSVAVGRPIGTAHSLQRKYPGGMTNHVHLELVSRNGAQIDATLLIRPTYKPQYAAT